jgi:hypothetical protein
VVRRLDNCGDALEFQHIIDGVGGEVSLPAKVQSWYQDLLEDRLNASRSFAGRRVSHNG